MKQHFIGTLEGTIYVLSFSPQQPQATVAINILTLQTIHCAHTSTAKAPRHQTKLNSCSERPETSAKLCPTERAGDRQTHGPGSGF